MEEGSKRSQHAETDNFLKRKVSLLVWHCIIMAIFNIIYPPVVVNYVISKNIPTSHHSHVISNDHAGFNNNSPKELPNAKNPAGNLQTKQDSVIGKKNPKSQSATPAPQKSSKKNKKTGKNKQRVLKHISSSSYALEEYLHLERYKDISSFPEKKSLHPPDNISNRGNIQSRHLEFTTPNATCNGTWYHLHLHLCIFTYMNIQEKLLRQ